MFIKNNNFITGHSVLKQDITEFTLNFLCVLSFSKLDFNINLF